MVRMERVDLALRSHVDPNVASVVSVGWAYYVYPAPVL